MGEQLCHVHAQHAVEFLGSFSPKEVSRGRAAKAFDRSLDGLAGESVKIDHGFLSLPQAGAFDFFRLGDQLHF